MKRYVLYSAVLFFAASILGFVTSFHNPASTEETLGSLASVADILQTLPDWQIFAIIFLNNAIKSFLAIVLGVFFGVMPALMLVVNGFIVGTVFYLAWSEGAALTFAAGVLPHGIIEIPVFLFASAFGFKLASTLVRNLFAREDGADIWAELKHALGTFAKFLLPLLLLAALIEAYVTPILIGG